MSGVISSLKDGQVWASWTDDRKSVRRGPVAEVSAMMRDFLQQVELGERLSRQAGPSD